MIKKIMLGITITAAAFVGTVSVSAAQPSQSLLNIGVLDIEMIDNEANKAATDSLNLNTVSYTQTNGDIVTTYYGELDENNTIDIYVNINDISNDMALYFLNADNTTYTLDLSSETAFLNFNSQVIHWKVTFADGLENIAVIGGMDNISVMNNDARTYTQLTSYYINTPASATENIFTHLNAIIMGFVGLLIGIFADDGIIGIFWDTSGETGQLTLISILMLFGFGFYLVKYGFKFIYNLLKLKGVFK